MTLHHFSRSVCRNVGALPVLLPAIVLAHPGHDHLPGETDEFDSFAAGILHPWSGIDHLVLALAIGWIALLAGRRRFWLPATAFLASLIAGAFAGRNADSGSFVEISIAATLIFAGMAFLRPTPPTAIATAIAAAGAGLIHGFAHGAEAMIGASFGPLTAGLTLSTAVIVIAGCALGHASSQVAGLPVVKSAGGLLIALGGLAMIQAF